MLPGFQRLQFDMLLLNEEDNSEMHEQRGVYNDSAMMCLNAALFLVGGLFCSLPAHVSIVFSVRSLECALILPRRHCVLALSADYESKSGATFLLMLLPLRTFTPSRASNNA